jgi:hypothetical protein
MALTTGDFDGDGFFDLAVGAPFEDINALPDVGTVNVLFGDAPDLNADSVTLTQDAGNEADDHFGATLSSGRFNLGAAFDLVVGAPFENIGTLGEAGAVFVRYGGTTPFGVTDVLSQDTTGMQEIAEPGDEFGGGLSSTSNGNAPSGGESFPGIPGITDEEQPLPAVEAKSIRRANANQPTALLEEADKETSQSSPQRLIGTTQEEMRGLLRLALDADDVSV